MEQSNPNFEVSMGKNSTQQSLNQFNYAQQEQQR
jgi:hypothetical protein